MISMTDKYTELRRRILALVTSSRSERAVKYWWRHYLHLCGLCTDFDYRQRSIRGQG